MQVNNYAISYSHRQPDDNNYRGFLVYLTLTYTTILKDHYEVDPCLQEGAQK